MERNREFKRALLELDRSAAQRLIADAMGAMSPIDVAHTVVMPVLRELGDDWEQGAVALSQIYMSGRICEQLIDEILPPAALGRQRQPKVAIATLLDYHLLGKRIVYSHVRASGFELADYGRMGVEDLVNRIVADGVEIILVSALMLASALKVQDVRVRLDRLAPQVKLVVGGAPFNMDKRLWQAVGADAMGVDSADAVSLLAGMSREKAPWK